MKINSAQPAYGSAEFDRAIRRRNTTRSYVFLNYKERVLARYRSWLFVPANRPDRITKAFASGADAVIMDLEDACPPAEKVAARAAVADAARRQTGARAFVRINAAATSSALADLTEVVVPGLAGVMLPKSETLAGLQAIDWAIGQLEAQQSMTIGSVELLPLIESALGIVDLSEIARSELQRIHRLTFGAGDMTLDLGARWTPDEAELFPFRTSLVAVSRAAGLEPPIDTVWPWISDHEGLQRCLAQSNNLGFSGKLLIHPNHVGVTNEVFTPSEETIAYAKRVIAAAAEAEAAGQGAFQLDGLLVDHVNVVQARRILESSGVLK
jgi:citrate lyase subunit beta / citryl-CoA lyase